MNPTPESLPLLPCPFCGSNPVIEQGKRGSCQLHGEPFQGVVIRCKKHDCPAKPRMEDGDIYNGGYEKAKAEVTKLWNTRATKQANQTREG